MRFLAKAPAKINLTLRLLGRLNDGYHLLHSLIVPITLYDEIELNVRQGVGNIRFTCQFSSALETHLLHCTKHGTFSETEKEVFNGVDNIAVRALRAMVALTPDRDAVDIDLLLKKHIPFQAGLGGGSSDAAQVIMLANTALGLKAPRDTLLSIAEQLGSDVAPCLFAGPVFVSGKGRAVEQLLEENFENNDSELGHPAILVAKLPFGIRTENAYQIHDEMFPTLPVYESEDAFFQAFRSDLSQALVVAEDSLFPLFKMGEKHGKSLGLSRSGDDSKFGEFLFNDFEQAIFRAYPELFSLREAIVRHGAFRVLLAGSGSALVGFFRDEQEVVKIMSDLERDLPEGTFLSSAKMIMRYSHIVADQPIGGQR